MSRPGPRQFRISAAGVPKADGAGPDDGGPIRIGPFLLEPGPETRCTRTQSEAVDLCLIGTAIDYSRPLAPVADVLKEVASALSRRGPGAVAEATRTLGGRWLVVWWDGRSAYAFLDAVGMVRLFCSGAGDTLVAGPDPSVFADGPAAREAAAVYAARMGGEYWWPGPVSPWPGVRQLLANHVLDLRSGTATRLWPTGAVPPRELDDAVRDYCGLLRGAFAAIGRKPGDYCLTLTAGHDTRILLAGARPLVHKGLACFTFRYHGMSDEHQDLRIPRRLAAEFDLPHVEIRTAEQMTDSFARRYRAGVIGAHDAWGPLAEAMAVSPLGRRVLLKGIPGTEIFSNIRGPLSPHALDDRALRVVAELPDVACVRESLAEWYLSLAPVCREGRLQFTEMLSWEQIHGCWQGMSQEEYARVQDTFAPLNCRALYESAFAVAPRFRRGRMDTTFIRRVIEELWPELLELPIDPDFSARASQRMRRRMGRAFRSSAPRAYLRYLRAARSREERRRTRQGGS